jgi:hypothetical protein
VDRNDIQPVGGRHCRHGVALAATILEYISNKNISNNIDIRADLVFILPLLLIAWLVSVGLLIFAFVRMPAEAC